MSKKTEEDKAVSAEEIETDIPQTPEPNGAPAPEPEVETPQTPEPEPETETLYKGNGLFTLMVIANCERLNVRNKPIPNASIIDVLPAGTVLAIDSIKDGWAHIYNEMSVEGYVMEEFIKER